MSCKNQFLDPLGSICHIITLKFKPPSTRISFINHAVVIQDPTNTQWLDRFLNGDNREDIFLLYYVVKRVIEWYIVPLYNYAEKKIEHPDFRGLNNYEITGFWNCLKDLCLYFCDALICLQETYLSGNVVTSIQYYIL